MDYRTVLGEGNALYEEKHSEFYAYVKGIDTYDEGLAFVKVVAKKHSDATHNCYAILMQNGDQKFSDDGEPQGTAGQPILQVLKKSDLSGVVLVVSRYFGGIKLGAGGLVQAYTKAAVAAIAAAKVVPMTESAYYSLRLPYKDADVGIRLAVRCGGKVVEQKYDESVDFVFAAPLGSAERFLTSVQEAFNGKQVPVFLKTGYEIY